MVSGTLEAPRPAAATKTSASVGPCCAPQLLRRLAWAGVLLLGLALPASDVWRPVDGTIREPWRETDVAAMARNFAREGMHLAYPRIDWRGAGPGYVESELPLAAWIVGGAYRLVGEREELLRVASYLLMLAAGLVFYRLARSQLPPDGAWAACLVFAASPMTVRMATAIQPEPLMLLGYVAGVYWFTQWLGSERVGGAEQARRSLVPLSPRGRGVRGEGAVAEAPDSAHQNAARRVAYTLALLGTMLAILGKLPAIHVGLLFACLCLQRFGWRAVVRRDVWVFAILAVGVPAAWYLHARGIWRTYGNSLGMSNEAYLRMGAGGLLSGLRETIPGNLDQQFTLVLMLPWVAVGLLGLVWAARDRSRSLLWFWGLTLGAYFIVAGRTTGEEWAWAYHVVALPWVALVVGAGVHEGRRLLSPDAEPRAVVRVALLLLGGLGLGLALHGLPGKWMAAASIAGLGLALAGEWLVGRHWPLYRSPTAWPQATVATLVCATFATGLLWGLRQVRADLHPTRFVAAHQAALEFRALMEPGALVAATGGEEINRYGLPSAYDAPYFFYWTDHHGFTLGRQSLTLDNLAALRARGARYLIVEREAVRHAPEFLPAVRSRYRLLAERELALLFEL